MNPFLVGSEITTRRKRITVKGGKAIVDVETGQREEVAEVVMVREVDDAQFVKLFTQNLKAFFDLTPIAMKLLQVVLHQLQQTPNRDQILLNLLLAEQYWQTTQQPSLSRSSFHRAVREMLEKQFLAESVMSGLYYINPNLFFNGDRVRFVTEIKRRRSDADHSDRVRRLRTGDFPASAPLPPLASPYVQLEHQGADGGELPEHLMPQAGDFGDG